MSFPFQIIVLLIRLPALLAAQLRELKRKKRPENSSNDPTTDDIEVDDEIAAKFTVKPASKFDVLY
jgi:hypothetical protein